ncbi:MAG: CoA transferase [Acidobacteriota bacterium]|nr:CoA transferase [Acidobacteriota bacterium]MDH3522904.1 CoA transferase [Acidobacteriota bacterium]
MARDPSGDSTGARGPLAGYRFVELAGLGPTQLAGMLLADMGADVVRVEPPGGDGAGIALPRRFDLMSRGRRSVAVDLKHAQGPGVVLRLVAGADAIFEGFRPGVAERLGLGPAVCLARNPRLVYGRMTGWGQDGPLAGAVGHDPNFIALAGALHAMGPPDGPPVPPLNLVGDFGGGALYLVAGLLAALLEVSRSGRGQVVDAAMVDGAASMMTVFHGLAAAGLWNGPRGRNLLDGGAYFHRAYETRDGKFVAVGALERRFHDALLRALGIEADPGAGSHVGAPERWPVYEKRLAAAFKTKTRDEWCALLEGTAACVSPALALDEAPRHPHNEARGTYLTIDGITQPAPAPRFDRTPGAVRNPPPARGRDTRAVLAEAGFSEEEIGELLEQDAIVQDETGAEPRRG